MRYSPKFIEALDNEDTEHGAAPPIYYFDVVHDYPAIGGIVEFSQVLFRQLKKRYGRRLISATEAAAQYGAPDASMPYLHRERRVAEILALADPRSIFFFPNFHSPIARQPRREGPRVVNVVHDVQFAFLPELFSEGRLRWLNRAFAQVRENADQVVFISETTRQQYIGLFGEPRQHTVIYNPIEIDSAAATAKDHGAPFLLASIHNHPHKNFSGLLSLFASLAERSPELELVVTGHGGEAFASHLADLPQAVRARVRHLGYVPRRELDGLYRRAHAFATLSHFEGFNMSAAEAASHGTPLILSDLPVHRELFTGQACFVDPASPSVDAVISYLAGPRDGAPWPLRALCDPAGVGRAYADVIDTACRAVESRTLLRRERRQAAIIAPPRSVSAGALSRALLSTTMLAGAAAALTLALTPAPAYAGGGAGGGLMNWDGVAGGQGYMGDDGLHGDDASAGSQYFGGGGGGSGGGAGGDGNIYNCPVSQCSVPGAGGAGGTAGSPDGEDGVTPNYAGGGGGGGGGFHGNGFTYSEPTSDVTGGNGGNGGNAASTVSQPGSGGGGGGGGFGALFTGTPAIGAGANKITGGDGGNGGNASHGPFHGGGGGNGGHGVFFADPGAEFTTGGTVTGGDGGDGGLALGSHAGALGGNGGHGGAGIVANGMAIGVYGGTVQGGDGGAGGASPTGTAGQAGFGGVGIVGTNLTIFTSGHIAGGLSGHGGRANAILFAGGSNSLTFQSATATFEGNIAIDGGGTLTLDQYNGIDATIDTAITGDGTLIKDGGNSVTLNGSNTYSGLTFIREGTLVVNGSIAGETTVQSGGTLSGGGKLADVTIASGGIHAPGKAGFGEQFVSGAYSVSSGGTLEIDASAAGKSDKVIVHGSVDITGSILSVMAVNGDYDPSTDYTIIDNDGSDAVAGTFAETKSNLAFLTPTVSYDGGDGNDVVLTLARNDTGMGEVTHTPNQGAIAGFINKLGAGNELHDAVVPLSEEGARQAFDALSGEVYGSVQGSLQQDTKMVQNLVFGRFNQFTQSGGQAGGQAGGQTGGIASAGQPTTVAMNSDPLPGRMALGAGTDNGPGDGYVPARTNGLVFWAQGYGSWGEVDGDGNAAGIDRRIGGFISGMDTGIGHGWRAGAAAGYSQTNVDAQARLSSAEIDSYYLAAYAGGPLGSFMLRSGASWTWHGIDSERTIVFPGVSNGVEASYDGDTGQLFGEVALPFNAGRTTIEPFAGLSWARINTDGFTESGGFGALTVGSTKENIGYSTLGVRATTEIRTNGLLLIPRLSVAWQHAFDELSPGASVSFGAGASELSIAGTPIAQNSVLLEAGVGLALTPSSTLGISYQGQLADGAQDHGIEADFSVRF